MVIERDNSKSTSNTFLYIWRLPCQSDLKTYLRHQPRCSIIEDFHIFISFRKINTNVQDHCISLHLAVNRTLFHIILVNYAISTLVSQYLAHIVLRHLWVIPNSKPNARKHFTFVYTSTILWYVQLYNLCFAHHRHCTWYNLHSTCTIYTIGTNQR